MGIVRKEEELVVSPGCRHTSDLWNVIVGLCLQTLSERDIEYHISANHSTRQFKDLQHQEVIVSRLGFNLTVSHGDDEVRHTDRQTASDA